MKKLALVLVVLGTLVANNAFALGHCPTNYAPLKSHPEVCVPAAKNLGKIDRLVNSCVARNINKVQTEYAAKNLSKTCASAILNGQDWRRLFD